MSQPKPLHLFLEGFRTEHQGILEHLKSCLQASAFRDFFTYAHTRVELNVETKEELFLFSAIAEKTGIQAGGPMCMLYYSMHMSSSALDQAAAATCLPKLQVETMKLNEIRRHFFEKNSPVCIPLKDHIAGEQIVAHALAILESKSPDPKELHHLAYIYLEILKLHFEKEDNCLLPMAQSLLSTVELDALLMNSTLWGANQP